MDIALFVPVIRQFLQVIGGMLIARGWLDEGAADALIGIIVNLLVFIWWLMDRQRINRKNRELKQKAGGPDNA